MIDPVTLAALRRLASDLSADIPEINYLGGLLGLALDALDETATEANGTLARLASVIEIQNIQSAAMLERLRRIERRLETGDFYGPDSSG